MAKVILLGTFLSSQFLPQVQSPKLPASTDLPYVTSEQENNECFSDSDNPKPGGLSCPRGYYKQFEESFTPCKPCPFNESIQTYQPQENRCPKCILCTNCSALGLVVVENCTIFNDTICGVATELNFGVPTTEDVSSGPSPSSTLIDDTSSTTAPAIKPSDCPPCGGNIPHTKCQRHEWLWALVVPFYLFTIMLLGCLFWYKRGTYKSRIGKLKADLQRKEQSEAQLQERVRQLEEELRRIRSGENGDAQDGSGESGQENGDIRPIEEEEDVENGPPSTQPLLLNGQNGNYHVGEGVNETAV